jgi:HD-GYP domain-containing protein (c-di-GMP phosphodiesterase class II)
VAAATRRRTVPLRVRVYVGAALATASLLLAVSYLLTGVHLTAAAISEALILAALIAFAWRQPVQVGLKRKINVGTAAAVAAVILLPSPLPALTLLVGTIVGEARVRAPLVQRLFNAANAVLRASLSVLVHTAILRLGPAAIAEPVADLAAVITLYATAKLLVIGISAVQLRENPLRRTWAPDRELLVVEAMLSVTGILAALAAACDAWALPLLIAPALIAQRALRDGVALKAQTRLALEELADIVDMRDHYTFEHSRRVAELARATARQLGLPAAQVELVTMAGRVHDVGKIGIKSSVLMKPQGLTDREWREMRSHPEVGARLIAHFPQFAEGRTFVLHHHERFDGGGYPLGLAGEAIPMGARVLAVADAWDAMTSHRAYRTALEPGQVYVQLEQGRGRQFDPAILDAFLSVLAARPDLAQHHTDQTQEIDVPELAAVPS